MQPRPRIKPILTAAEVAEHVGCSRSKAIEIICKLNGSKDACGRWTVDARKFFSWYASPTRNYAVGGGEHEMRMIDKLVCDVRGFAGKDSVSFTLMKRRRSPFWCLRVLASGRDKLISLKTEDKKTATAMIDEVKARFREQSLSGLIPIRTTDLIDEWLMMKENSVRSKSYCRYRAVMDKTAAFLPEQAHTTTTANIERYKMWLTKEGYHPSSIIYELRVLQSLFAFAARLGYVRSNPVEGVEHPKRPESEITNYTPDELEAIFAELERRTHEGFRDQSLEAWEAYTEIFHCLNYTGMRISDALNLKWENINLAFGTIELHQVKTGRVVYIRIPTAFRERLKRLAETKGATGYVYTNTAGNPIKYSRIDTAIRIVLRSIGITKRSPIHSFRHTTAQRLLSAGVSVDSVAGQLGDTVETVTRVYLRPVTASQAAIDRAYDTIPADKRNVVEPQFDQVSQKCHNNIEEIAVFRGNAGQSDKRLILQKTH